MIFHLTLTTIIPHLHSTMVLFEYVEMAELKITEINLHSTMVLF